MYNFHYVHNESYFYYVHYVHNEHYLHYLRYVHNEHYLHNTKPQNPVRIKVEWECFYFPFPQFSMSHLSHKGQVNLCRWQRPLVFQVMDTLPFGCGKSKKPQPTGQYTRGERKYEEIRKIRWRDVRYRKKAQGLHQMQLYARGGAKPGNVPCIAGNLRLNQYDMQKVHLCISYD